VSGPPENVSAFWDDYVKREFPILRGDRTDLPWPGDEWGNPDGWRDQFETLFWPARAAQWRDAVEIGPGSGKYTLELLNAVPDVRVHAYDVSPSFLAVCAERCRAEIDAGRLRLACLESRHARELLDDLDRHGLAGGLDGFYSIDAMVHVDLQYLVVYLLTAALALRQDGHLVLTLADAGSDKGFAKLMKDASHHYPRQGRPSGKFEWLGKELVTELLGRLGFELVFMDNYLTRRPGEGRDICLAARLASPDLAEKLRHHLDD
jgi:SAM-dependent methyltransferase